MSIDKRDADSYTRGELPQNSYEVVVSTDGGNSYVRYATGINNESDAYEAFDHHSFQMLEAMRSLTVPSGAIVELLNRDSVVASVTMQHHARTRPAYARTNRAFVSALAALSSAVDKATGRKGGAQ